MIAQYIEDKQAVYKKYKEIFTGVIASEIEFPYQPGIVGIYLNINKENGKRLSRKER